jgi:ankyrin repeat protein
MNIAGAIMDKSPLDEFKRLQRVIITEDIETAKKLGIIKEALDKGTDPNLKNEDDYTLLHMAVKHKQREIEELLIARKADVNAKNKNGNTPLHIVAMWGTEPGYTEMADPLLDAKANPHEKNKEGKTALDIAKKPELQQKLMEAMRTNPPSSFNVTKQDGAPQPQNPGKRGLFQRLRR